MAEVASTPRSSQVALALYDLVEGARVTHLWGRLGWQDIRRRYRRSTLGPFWITISMGLLVGVLGTLYGGLFKVQATNYVPYLTLGFVIWTLVNGLITDGCTAFVNASNIIQQARLPLSVHVYRVVWRNLIIFFHNAVIFVVVAMVFSVWPGWTALLVIPGMMLLLLMDEWLSVGDRHLVEKARERLEEFVDRAGILVLASQKNANLLKRVCTKGVLLDAGKLRATGPIGEVLGDY
ncbi:MAG: ABC transporter permease [Gammaproteobacteria bacterium]|nr:ABC transporter permease [Gammaproteobacteria bacterium]